MLSWTFAAAAAVLVLLSAVLPRSLRPVVLTVVSLLGVAVVWHVPLGPIGAVALAVYALGRLLPTLPDRVRGLTAGVAIAAVVAALVVFKLGAAPSTTLVNATRVVGLSYFALKFIQHLADAAAGRAAPVDLTGFLCTVFFLPTYPAGPIERTTDFSREIAAASPGLTDAALGLERIVFGLGRKFLLADPLLAYAEPLFRDPASGSAWSLLLAVYAFALGLYLDFAAASDLAIGVGRAAGVRVRENFDNPYLTRNLQQLWQRWHMSLTGWLRDFVFVPVARRVLRRTGRPLLGQTAAQTATMLACGLWHGVAWNYALWGAYHAAGLVGLTLWRARRGPVVEDTPLARAVATLATFHFFAFGLVLFACDLPRAALLFTRLLGLGA